MSGQCFMCGAEVKEGDAVSGWILFNYASLPVCTRPECADAVAQP